MVADSGDPVPVTPSAGSPESAAIEFRNRLMFVTIRYYYIHCLKPMQMFRQIIFETFHECSCENAQNYTNKYVENGKNDSEVPEIVDKMLLRF